MKKLTRDRVVPIISARSVVAVAALKFIKCFSA
jgi:hypothetical protein